MTPPLVTCIVPVFNGERYLADALASIVAQSYSPLEIVVVDDGSTDGTAAIARGGRYPVRYLAQVNAGPAAARNRGIDAAQGTLVAFLDADDRWHPEKLRRQADWLDRHPAPAAVVAHAEMFGDPETTPARGGRPTGTAIPAYISGTLVAPVETFRRVGLFDERLKHADDTDWFLRARRAGVEVGLVADVLLFRRLHDGNMSATGRSGSFDEYLRLLKSNLDARRRASLSLPGSPD